MARPPQLPPSPPASGHSDQDVCRYIAEMCAELRHMSRRPSLRMVNYLLDLVRLEAEKAAGAPRPGR